MIVAEMFSWWVIAIGVWMASLSAYSGQELVVASGCAVPCAVAATAARRAIRGGWSMPSATLPWLLLLPAVVVSDAVRVLSWPLRSRSGGTMHTLDIGVRGSSARANGRRAAAAFVLSSTPGSYVVAADEQAGTLTVHGLGDASALERAVSR